ncbi:hypothetical protein G3I60_04925 [Streptomyces sp. SID13666]|uniref:hypothetical protein n=1 Tax=Streptomyces sp. SID13666 TaxID=2706054 RepID=UPI0013C20CEF|nr:hypothetical protein [Streptomyces sp. SID13666]NEA53512.1 hypothetical protein [Streptomyces sp. SID13666]
MSAHTLTPGSVTTVPEAVELLLAAIGQRVRPVWDYGWAYIDWALPVGSVSVTISSLGGAASIRLTLHHVPLPIAEAALRVATARQDPASDAHIHGAAALRLHRAAPALSNIDGEHGYSGDHYQGWGTTVLGAEFINVKIPACAPDGDETTVTVYLSRGKSWAAVAAIIAAIQ